MKTLIFSFLFLLGSTLFAQEQLVGQWSGLGQDEQMKTLCDRADLNISQEQNVMVVHEAHFSCSGELAFDLHDLEFHIDNGLLIYKNKIVGHIHGGKAQINLPATDSGNVEVTLNRAPGSDSLLVRIAFGKISGNIFLTRSWLFDLRQ